MWYFHYEYWFSYVNKLLPQTLLGIEEMGEFKLADGSESGSIWGLSGRVREEWVADFLKNFLRFSKEFGNLHRKAPVLEIHFNKFSFSCEDFKILELFIEHL